MTDDPTICNECVCAFCPDKAQVIDLCPLHAPTDRLSAAREGVVKALGRLATASEHWLEGVHDEGFYGKDEDALPAAITALKELRDAQTSDPHTDPRNA